MLGLIADGRGKIELKSEFTTLNGNAYEVITKTIACGICNGTDLKLVEGGLKNFSSYPAILGHESVGEVVFVGDKVRNYKVGDRVLRTNLKNTKDYYSLWGGFAEFGYASDYNALLEDGLSADEGSCTQQILPKSITPIDGTMVITLKEVCSALHRLGIKKHDNIAIIGCGPVGIAMVALARVMGAGNIILSGHHEQRLKTGKKVGANVVVQAKKQNLIEIIKEEMPQGVDLFIDCVGSTEIINQGMNVIKETGKIGIYGTGLTTGDMIDWNNAPYNFNIHSVQWPISREEMKVHEEVINYIEAGKIDLKDFVTDILPISDFEQGFQLVNERIGLKVVLAF